MKIFWRICLGEVRIDIDVKLMLQTIYLCQLKQIFLFDAIKQTSCYSVETKWAEICQLSRYAYNTTPLKRNKDFYHLPKYVYNVVFYKWFYGKVFLENCATFCMECNLNVKFSKLGLYARGVKNKISRDVDIVLT